MGRSVGHGRARAAAVAFVVVAASAFGATAWATPVEGGGTATLTGVVRDGTTVAEVPVDLVSVCLNDGTGRVCKTTSASGRFTFTNVATGGYSLTATPPSGTAYLPIGGSGTYVPVPAVALTLASGSQTQDLTLQKGGHVEVTVRAPDGFTPAVDEPVTACRTDDSGPGSCPAVVALPATDARGRSSSPALLPGVYQVTAGAGGSLVVAPATQTDVIVDPEDTVPVTLTLVDIGAPTVTGAPERVPDANGWYRSPVTIDWTVVDPEPSSGLASTPRPTVAGSEGTNAYSSDDAVDQAGNRARGSYTVSLDTVAPSVTCPTGVAFSLHEPGAAITATVADGTSGPDPASGSTSVDTSIAGVGSVWVTGRDLAANETTVPCGYVVEDSGPYEFRGFGWPIDGDAINVVKSGRNVPLSWRVTDGQGLPVTGADTVVGVTSAVVACPDLRSSLVWLTVPFAIAPTHLGGGYWLATWRAPKAVPGSCIEMQLTLDDATTHTALFRVVK